MDSLIIKLKTGDHCIQTAAKNELRRISDIIMFAPEGNVSDTLGEQYELLEDFLNITDFNRLRSSDQRYAGITPSICILSRDDSGNPVISIEN